MGATVGVGHAARLVGVGHADASRRDREGASAADPYGEAAMSRGPSRGREFDHWHPGIASRIPRRSATSRRSIVRRTSDRRGPGGRALRSHRSRLQRARGVSTRSAPPARAPDPGHRRYLGTRRLEDRGSGHQFSTDREHDPHPVHRAGTARDRGEATNRCGGTLRRSSRRSSRSSIPHLSKLPRRRDRR